MNRHRRPGRTPFDARQYDFYVVAAAVFVLWVGLSVAAYVALGRGK